MSHTDYDGFRSYWYPKLHYGLSLVGLGATGTVGRSQYVCSIDSMDEHEIEHLLMDLGFVQNPLAYYKSDPHGTGSVGSWVLTYETAVKTDHNPWLNGYANRDEIHNPSRQLHVTLFPRNDGFDLYAHEEQDWRDDPIGHLREVHWRPRHGRQMMRWIVEQHTDLERDTDYSIEMIR